MKWRDLGWISLALFRFDARPGQSGRLGTMLLEGYTTDSMVCAGADGGVTATRC